QTRRLLRTNLGRFRHLAVFSSQFRSDAPFAEMHQHLVDRQAMKPRRKRRFATKRFDLAMKLEKHILSQIFGFAHIPGHTQTYRKNASIMLLVQSVKAADRK